MSYRSGAVGTFARPIDPIALTLIFMWVGIALFADLSWTEWLIGIAIILFAAQSALFLRDHPLDVSMAAAGVALLFNAFVGVGDLPWSLLPTFLFVIGIVIIVDVLRPPHISSHE